MRHVQYHRTELRRTTEAISLGLSHQYLQMFYFDLILLYVSFQPVTFSPNRLPPSLIYLAK